MDPNSVQHDIKTLVEGYISLDPVEYDAAINQYFDAHAVVTTEAFSITGAYRIKQLTALYASWVEASELVGAPAFDEQAQVIHFSYKRRYKNFALRNASSPAEKPWQTYDVVLHLHPEEDYGSGKGVKSYLYVTKVDFDESRASNAVPSMLYSFIRPFLSVMVMALAAFLAFCHRHQKDNFIGIMKAAFTEAYDTVWSLLLAETSKRSAQADIWRDEKVEYMQRLIHQARATKSGASAQGASTQMKHVAATPRTRLASQAESAGFPMEEYKQHAWDRVQGLTARFADIMNAREAHSGTANGEPSNGHDHSLTDCNGIERPLTPLGGHNPLSPDAPSYAEAVRQ